MSTYSEPSSGGEDREGRLFRQVLRRFGRFDELLGRRESEVFEEFKRNMLKKISLQNNRIQKVEDGKPELKKYVDGKLRECRDSIWKLKSEHITVKDKVEAEKKARLEAEVNLISEIGKLKETVGNLEGKNDELMKENQELKKTVKKYKNKFERFEERLTLLESKKPAPTHVVSSNPVTPEPSRISPTSGPSRSTLTSSPPRASPTSGASRASPTPGPSRTSPDPPRAHSKPGPSRTSLTPGPSRPPHPKKRARVPAQPARAKVNNATNNVDWEEPLSERSMQQDVFDFAEDGPDPLASEPIPSTSRHAPVTTAITRPAHGISSQTTDTVFICNCGKSVKTHNGLMSHIERHTTEPKFSCDVCHKKFHSLSKCNKHMNDKHNTLPGQEEFTGCKMCGLKFANRREHRAHLKVCKEKANHGPCHRRRRRPNGTRPDKPKTTRRVRHYKVADFKCNCGLTKTSLGKLNEHLRYHKRRMRMRNALAAQKENIKIKIEPGTQSSPSASAPIILSLQDIKCEAVPNSQNQVREN